MKLKKIEENSNTNLKDEALQKDFLRSIFMKFILGQNEDFYLNINKEINLHLSNTSTTEEEKSRLNELVKIN